MSIFLRLASIVLLCAGSITIPGLGMNGVVFFGSTNGYLYALE